MRNQLIEDVCSGRVACAYYDPVKCTIYVLEDTPDNKHFDLTKACEFRSEYPALSCQFMLHPSPRTGVSRRRLI